jgi:drug/metabolite transporter (DMT)-like permease
LILLTTLFWGGTPVAGKLVIREIPPLTAGVLRYGLTSLLLIAACWRQLPDPRALRRSDLWLLFWVGIFGTFLNHVLFFLGLVHAPAAHASIIPPTTSPIWTMILAARLGKERATGGQVAGTVLCLAGVLLVIHPERLLTGGGGNTLLGDMLFLLGGGAWGVYSFLSKAAMARLSAVTTLAYAMVVGTVFLVPLALTERPWTALRTAHLSTWGALAYITVAGTLLSFFWWNVALYRVGAGKTAVFTNLVPVFGVILAWLILGERLTAIQLVGGLLAVGGVLACQRPASPATARRSILRRRFWPWTSENKNDA